MNSTIVAEKRGIATRTARAIEARTFTTYGKEFKR